MAENTTHHHGLGCLPALWGLFLSQFEQGSCTQEYGRSKERVSNPAHERIARGAAPKQIRDPSSKAARGLRTVLSWGDGFQLNKPCAAWPWPDGSRPTPGTGLGAVVGPARGGVCFSWLQWVGKAEKVSPGKELTSWREFSRDSEARDHSTSQLPCATRKVWAVSEAEEGGNRHTPRSVVSLPGCQRSPLWRTGGSNQRRPGQAQGGMEPAPTPGVWKESLAWNPRLLTSKFPVLGLKGET